jgi:hypothetical protein
MISPWRLLPPSIERPAENPSDFRFLFLTITEAPLNATVFVIGWLTFQSRDFKT